MAHPIPDLPTFKKLAHELLGPRLKVKLDYGETSFTMALALSAAVKKVFFEKSEKKFSAEPLIEKRLIIQFVQRMRVDAMEKFNKTTFLSYLHFYQDHAAFVKQLPIGVIIVYIERKFVPEMLRLFKYPYIDYDNDDEVLDGIGAITNLIAGYFKKELARLGYLDLEMSPFKSAINNILDGIVYPPTENEKYEISFEIEEEKRMVIEMVMGVLLTKSKGHEEK